jgi:hypothetical protein
VTDTTHVTCFRKRPVVVEAVRWTGDNAAQVREFAGGLFKAVDPEGRNDDPDITAEVLDKLHSTWVGVKTGQWVVRGVKGEFYPIDQEVLDETYDPAADDDGDAPEPLIVSEDPVLNGPRLSWYASMSKAEYHHDVLTASRDGVLPDGNTFLHQIPSSWLSAAVRAHRLLREGKAGEALAMATHERLDGRIVEVTR